MTKIEAVLCFESLSFKDTHTGSIKKFIKHPTVLAHQN